MMNAITEFQKDLVSVCIPCYNVEAYMAKHLRSLMDQTYKKLEVILVDDGSTDGTLGIIEQHVPLLEGCGYVVKVISQENGGQSSAINTALKHFSGEFLTWEDPDDWLAADSIQKRLAFLKSHPSAAFQRIKYPEMPSEYLLPGSARRTGPPERSGTSSCQKSPSGLWPAASSRTAT